MYTGYRSRDETQDAKIIAKVLHDQVVQAVRSGEARTTEEVYAQFGLPAMYALVFLRNRGIIVEDADGHLWCMESMEPDS